MFKKVILWTVYVLIVGLLVFGAANRTSAKTDQGILFGNLDEIIDGRGQGNGSAGNSEGYGENEIDDHEEILEEHDWVSFRGQIIAVGVESLEIQTGTAGILEIEGRPLRFAQELGYVPGEGNEVAVQGFYEDGEFEVATIEDLATDQNFQLRDEYGKPMWGGGGRN